MTRALAAACVAIALASPAAAQPKSDELHGKLHDRLDAVARQLDGVMGFVVVDLTSRRRIERLHADVFPTASTIKLARWRTSPGDWKAWKWTRESSTCRAGRTSSS